jgi:Ni/Co efflux regulator RcnB
MTKALRTIIAGALAFGAMAAPAMAQGKSHKNDSKPTKSTHSTKKAVVHRTVTNRGTRVLCEDGTLVYGSSGCADRGGLAARQGNYGTTPRASERAREVANENSAVARSTTSSRGYANYTRSGSIARCSDGTYWHSNTRTNACYRHGGVARWY